MLQPQRCRRRHGCDDDRNFNEHQLVRGVGGSTSIPALTSSGDSTTSQSDSETSNTTGKGPSESTSNNTTTSSTGGVTETDGSAGESTGRTPVSFEGDYEGIILGECQEFPTGVADVDGSLMFSVFEDTAMSGSADLTVPYSDNTVPLTGTIDEEGAAEATLQVSGSVSCLLTGNADSDGEMTGTFTCVPHACDGLWSASPI